MREDIPSSIQDTTQNLSAEAIVRLYEVALTNGTIFRMSPTTEITWRSMLYEEIPCTMTDFSQDSDGKVTRPKFTVVNPEAMFSQMVRAGALDYAMVSRIRILKSDLEADHDFAIRERFRVSRIVSLTRTLIACELRDVLDGHFFSIPARSYMPPDFPYVQLS